MNTELFKLGFNEVTCLRERNLTPPRKAGVEFDGLVLSPLWNGARSLGGLHLERYRCGHRALNFSSICKREVDSAIVR